MFAEKDLKGVVGGMAQPIRIFLSSPSDVMEEQVAVKALVAEINDVIAFLSPHLDVRVEVLRYQDDVYPDVGRPQEVVDRGIPKDYEIHLGIMWMRCGTPTKTEDSGTIHEFRQAMKRRDATGWPIIMFYFSDEPPPVMPSKLEEIEQLSRVIKFREEMQNIGLTMTYPNRASFRERVRAGLLRAIADVAKSADRTGTAGNGAAVEVQNAPIPEGMRKLAKSYDSIRKTLPPGGDRTRRMASIFSSMCFEAPSARSHLAQLSNSASAGERLAAIAILSTFPDPEYLDWLTDRLDPDTETPFVGFQAGSALLQAVRSLSLEAETELRVSLDKALELAQRNPNDPPRINVLIQAQRELGSRNKQPKA